MIRRYLAALALAVLPSSLGCQNLPEIVEGVCGNGVLDPAEDCDDTSAACGRPGTPAACRFTCQTGDGRGCPSGFGCGGDGVCRMPSGELTGPVSVPLGAGRLLAADLGGTRTKSVVAVSRDVDDLGYPRMLSFARDGSVTSDEQIEGAFGLGHARDVNDDGHDDLLLVRTDGLLLTLGQGATSVNDVPSSLLPLPPGASARLVPIPVPNALSELVSLVSLPNGGSTVVLSATGGTLASFTQAPSAFLDRPATLPDADYLCHRALLAVAGERLVRELQPCCARGSECAENAVPGRRFAADGALVGQVVQTQYPIVDGPWTLDVNGDGRPDMVVATRRSELAGSFGSRVQLEVAFAGDDPHDRALFGDPPIASSAEGGQSAGRRLSTLLLELPSLGVPRSGSNSLDGLLDVGVETRAFERVDANNRVVVDVRRQLTVVVPRGVLYLDVTELAPQESAVQPIAVERGYARASVWTSAKLLSLNGDQFLDVVAGSARTVDLDVLTGTEILHMNSSTVRTGLTTDALALGDVDGDRTTDVIVSTRSGSTSALNVLFGRSGGLPAELRPIGNFEPVVQLTPVALSVGALSEDAATDIGVVTSSVGGDAVFLLRGTGGRVPHALYGLTGEVDQTGRVRTYRPMGATLAARSPGAFDVVALGYDGSAGLDARKPSLWFGAVERDGGRVSLGSPTSGPLLEVDPVLRPAADGTGDIGVNAMLRAIDVDGDGTEEVVCVTTNATRTDSVVLAAHRVGDALLEVLGPTPIVAPSEDGRPYLRVFGLEAVDVNRDGAVDLVMLLATAPLGDDDTLSDVFDMNARDTALVVVWNRNGKLDVTAPTRLFTREKVLAIGRGALTNPDAVDLVTVTTGGISVRSADGLDQVAVYAAENDMALHDARSVVVADVTGDGLDDVVVGTRERVHLYVAGER